MPLCNLWAFLGTHAAGRGRGEKTGVWIAAHWGFVNMVSGVRATS